MNNMQLTATIAGNLLTVTATPTRASSLLFHDPNAAAGDRLSIGIPPLSITTTGTGQTFGVSNNQPFRIWLVACYNGQGVFPALFQSVVGGTAPIQVAGLTEGFQINTTGIQGAGTAGGTFYTPGAISLSSVSFRVLGYFDWGNGLPTAGSFSTLPTYAQIFGPGIKLPNEVVRRTFMFTTTPTTVTNSLTITSTSASLAIVPTSAPNLVLARAGGTLKNADSSATGNNVSFAFLYRGNNQLPTRVSQDVAIGLATSANATATVPFMFLYLDAPGTVNSTTYQIRIQNSATGTSQSTTFLGYTPDVGWVELEEIAV